MCQVIRTKGSLKAGDRGAVGGQGSRGCSGPSGKAHWWGRDLTRGLWWGDGLHYSEEGKPQKGGELGPGVSSAGCSTAVKFWVPTLALATLCPAYPRLSDEGNNVCPVCNLDLLMFESMFRGYFEHSRNTRKAQVTIMLFSLYFSPVSVLAGFVFCFLFLFLINTNKQSSLPLLPVHEPTSWVSLYILHLSRPVLRSSSIPQGQGQHETKKENVLLFKAKKLSQSVITALRGQGLTPTRRVPLGDFILRKAKKHRMSWVLEVGQLWK